MARLGDVFELQITGEWGTECAENEAGTKVLRTTNFTSDGMIDYKNIVVRSISKSKVEKKRLRCGDIILEKSGGTEKTPVGRVVYCDKAIEDDIYLCNNFTQAMRVKREVGCSRYVFYVMWYLHYSGKTDLLQNKTTGIRNLQVKSYLDEEIPLPPLEEQHRIADLLDKVSDLIAKRRAQLGKLDLLVKARFVEMFGDQRTNPKGWKTGRIRDVVNEVKYGTSRPAVEGGTYKYLRMGNITFDGHLDLNDLKYIDIPEPEIEKCIVRKGDVLFNRTNSKELVGKTCVFDLDEPMVIAGYIIRVRVNERVIPEYLSAVLNSQYGKQTLSDMCKAIVGQANINAQELQNIAILIPPIELQREFALFIHRVNRLVSNVTDGIKKLETLKKALMQRVFIV